MRGTKTEAARRKLLSITSRPILEKMTKNPRPWALNRLELIADAALKENWDEDEVRKGIESIFKRASHEAEASERRVGKALGHSSDRDTDSSKVRAKGQR